MRIRVDLLRNFGELPGFNKTRSPKCPNAIERALQSMVTDTVQDSTNFSTTRTSNPLGYDFALLGLNASEARVDVIRRAATRTAARIHDASDGDEAELDLMLSDLVSSTYRLLDPRRRAKMMERVQLSIVSDSDLELQQGPRLPLLRASEPGPA
jgi:hypothetical protein